MSKNKTKAKKKEESGLSLFLVFIVSAVAAGVTFFALSVIMPPKKSGSENSSQTTSENSSSSSSEDETAAAKTPSQYEKVEGSDDPNSLNMGISKNEIINNKYQVRVTIYEILTESGTCELEMKSENDLIKRSANLINAGPDSTSCEGFDIETSDIPSGNYSITINVTSGERSGKAEGTIKI